MLHRVKAVAVPVGLALALVWAEAASAAPPAAAQASGNRWLVYIVVGGTLVVSLGGYIILKISELRDRGRDDDE
ncbi:MAG: hypothetical protein FJ000_07210 [Actinobacteria bacterium]|nr:hypothetical protein [Actinomycetota bacterium]